MKASIPSRRLRAQARALAVSGDHRSPGFPDLPTVAEAAGRSIPRRPGPRRDRAGGVPQPIVEALNAAINRAIHAPAMNQLYGHRRRAQSGTPKEFAALIASDSKKWGEMIERAGVKLN